jgi:hypothetical protein
MDTKKQKNKEFGGWNNEGKRMFNSLKDNLESDRAIHNDWEKAFLKENARLVEVLPTKRRHHDISQQADEVFTSNDLNLVFDDSGSSEEDDDECDGQLNHRSTPYRGGSHDEEDDEEEDDDHHH